MNVKVTSDHDVALLNKLTTACLLACVFLIAGLALLGSVMDIPILASAWPGLPPMKPITAMAFILSASSVSCTTRTNSPSTETLATPIALTTVSIAAIFLVSWTIQTSNALGTNLPGSFLHRHGMSPQSAATFLLLNTSVIFRKSALAKYFAVSALFVVLLVLVGYLYHITPWYSIDGQNGMSMPAMLAFAVLALTVIRLDVMHGFLGSTYLGGTGGRLLRLLWPMAVMPIGLSLLRAWGEKAGLLKGTFDAALMPTAMVLLITVLLWRSARLLNALDADLKSQQQWLQKSLAGIGEGVIVTDQTGRIRFMNPKAETLTGWTESKASGERIETVYKVIDELTSQPQPSPTVDVIRTGKMSRPLNHRCLLHRAGMAKPVDETATPIKNELGTLLGTVLSFREITDRRKAERELLSARVNLEREVAERTAALRNSEELYRMTLQALPAHIAVLDQKGQIVAVNQAWMEFAKQNAAQKPTEVAVGLNYLDVCRRAAGQDNADALGALHGIESVIVGTKPSFTMEYPCDGNTQERWFHMTVVPLRDTETTGAVVSHLDITDRKQAELQIRRTVDVLRRANDDLERFNRLAVGREKRVMQLKEEVNELCQMLGQTPRYMSMLQASQNASPDD